jgi:hypothetical protein
MRTANRPFQELLGLGRGICPFDWVDVLSTNQVRGIRRFLENVGLVGEPDTPDLWARAWSKAPVPGFRSASEFWTSEIGHALRNGPQAAASPPWGRPVTSGEAFIEPGSPPEILDEHHFRRQLALLQDDGVISAAERTLLERIYCGDTLTDLAADADVQAMLAQRGLQLPLLVADLQHRIENWQTPQGADHA